MTDAVRVPLRDQPDQSDHNDPLRLRLVRERWGGQDAAYRAIERTVEEHVRMLSGRQWDVFSDVLGRFVDPLKHLSTEERRWRQRPVMDFLGYWFMVTLSKVTENAPIVGFLPANGDDHSAMLAEVMDPIFKTLWDETEMDDRRMMAAAWALVAGEAYLVSRPDYAHGDTRTLTGPGVFAAPDGNEIVADDLPYDAAGNPLADVVEGEDGFAVEPTGDPYTDHKGKLKVEVKSPLEIRSQWGSHIPWTEKAWVIERWFLTPQEIAESYGQVVPADLAPQTGEHAPGALERMLFGTGHFGAARGALGGTGEALTEGYVCGYTMWEKPSPEFPEGRLTVIAGNTVLHDSPRPFVLEGAGPIRRLQFMPMPGRPIGTTPLEKMVPLQRRYNRVEAQIAEHTNLCTNPVLLIHSSSGIDTAGFRARPGLILETDAPPGVRGADWLSPPALGIDVWKHKGDVRDHLFTIGSITGNEGANPAADASGELIQQLRYNADRPLAPMTRSMELACAGVAEDWIAILPTIWTEETVIHYAGEDNIVKTVTVAPEMWDGSVRARPVLESAAPESREKRQDRVMGLYQLGAFGDLKDPAGLEKASRKLLELSRFPELSRAARPGGIHRTMAERNLGALLRGVAPETLPILPMYDLTVHLEVMNDYMAGPDYLTLAPEVMEALMRHRESLLGAAQAQAVELQQQQMAMQMDAQAAGLLPPSTDAPPPSEPGHQTKGIPDERRHTEPDLP